MSLPTSPWHRNISFIELQQSLKCWCSSKQQGNLSGENLSCVWKETDHPCWSLETQSTSVNWTEIHARLYQEIRWLGVEQPLPLPFNRTQTCGCHRNLHPYSIPLIFFSSFHCAYVYSAPVWAHLCVGGPAHVGPKVDILCYSPTSFSEVVSKSALELAGMAGHTSQLVLGGSQSCASELRWSNIYMGPRDLNSGLQACVAGT